MKIVVCAMGAAILGAAMFGWPGAVFGVLAVLIAEAVYKNKKRGG